jgi:hypothetical protein
MAELISVCIEIDDTGAITVGAEPPDADDGATPSAGADPTAATPGMTDLSQPPAADDESEEKSYMQPAKSIDDALSIARGLLRQATQAGGATMGGDPGGEGAQSSADAAFQSRRGGKAGF